MWQRDIVMQRYKDFNLEFLETNNLLIIIIIIIIIDGGDTVVEHNQQIPTAPQSHKPPALWSTTSTVTHSGDNAAVQGLHPALAALW